MRGVVNVEVDALEINTAQIFWLMENSLLNEKEECDLGSDTWP